MIDQDELHARRAKQVGLGAHAQVAAGIVNHPKRIALLAKKAGLDGWEIRNRNAVGVGDVVALVTRARSLAASCLVSENLPSRLDAPT